MPNVGGDIIDITCNHPTLGSATFVAKANEDSTFDEGGFRSNDDVNMIDGAGEMIDQMNRARWQFECTLAHDMNTREDLNKLTQYAESPVQGDWVISHINGAVYQGKGKPVGDVNANGNTATIALKLSGGGKLTKITG